ncbi:PAS domain-containing sensor histidine kinase [Hydrogenophaga sp.]|uniref:hybrid sensor histidine kinase/response regulator n=1 Tax=Hydrogenophaga sp. TaxID=1904254 RepID=UPI002730D3CF|nr:PAS domain-containing sensor histidine kinase [Hydrogenophaga sp.]MDP2074858.1 PAS domain-containing protein [Hydrogenophaga sp.]MDP3108865.1 PAS domain-containing protein [Hydrogenophaga sp.]MDP3350055.1 PAS domain-containing protein [Hydrogenophaga sp.]
MTPPRSPSDGDFSSLFNFLPIGAYRSLPDGQMLRANQALVRLNGYDDEAQLLLGVKDVATEWYVQPGRRAEFVAMLQRDGFVKGFISEIWRHKTRERVWISENAHSVSDPLGQVLFYEGTVEDITERIQVQQALRTSREQLEQITDQIPGMVFSLHQSHDGTRRYDFVSSGVRGIYEFEPGDLQRDPMLITRYRHPDDVGLLEVEAEAVKQAPVNLSGEFRIVLPDGRIKWVYKRSSAVHHDSQGTQRVGVLLDITARKEAETALHASETLWKLALESAGDGVWDWNIGTGEEFFSNSIKAMFGYADDDIANLSAELDARTHPDDLHQMQLDRQAHFDGLAPVYRNEHRIRCKDGRWKWVLSRGVVIARDDKGQPLRMVGTHTDITELKEAEAQQHALEVQLRESQKMEAIGTLAGGVAHDFNNLLAAILGNLVLAREDVGEHHPAQESLAEINRAAIRARQLVQQILTFSRRQTQEMQRQPLKPLVEEALGLMRSLLPAGLKLVTRLPSSSLQVLADATQMQQVLMNLCTNAWQSMEGRSGDITVALRDVRLDASQALQLGGLASGAYACLSVADNGPGMDAETQRRIFEPFFTTKAPGTGTGLGLAVVHGIVKAHRGAIDLHSRPGEGTRFDVYLPLAAEGSAGEASSAASPALPAIAKPAPAGKHVVYIDDYEALVFLVGRLLRKHGHEATTFESGEAALEWMRAHPEVSVDLVVSDHNMPGLSGVETAIEIRRLRPGLKIAIISGHVNDQLLTDAAAAGVSEVMGKQDSMDALGEAIRDLLVRAV